MKDTSALVPVSSIYQYNDREGNSCVMVDVSFATFGRTVFSLNIHESLRTVWVNTVDWFSHLFSNFGKHIQPTTHKTINGKDSRLLFLVVFFLLLLFFVWIRTCNCGIKCCACPGWKFCKIIGLQASRQKGYANLEVFLKF